MFAKLRLVISVLLLATACADRNNPFGSGTNTSDRTAPTVVSTVPGHLTTQAGLAAPITVTFSEVMSTSSIMASAFTFSPAISVTASYTGNTATLTPSTALTPSTTYTGTVTTVVEDRAGNNLVAPFSWSFTTGPTIAGIVR